MRLNPDDVKADIKNAIAKNMCVPEPIGCGKPISTFRDDLSEREYAMSGLCQECQDNYFDIIPSESDAGWYIVDGVGGGVIIAWFSEHPFTNRKSPYTYSRKCKSYASAAKILNNGKKPEICDMCWRLLDVQFGLKAHGFCKDCQRWVAWIEDRKKSEPDRYLVIAGEAFYRANDEATNHAFLGFGGREFRIKNLHTGKVIVTHNLWSNGTVPEHFRDLLPDTHICL